MHQIQFDYVFLRGILNGNKQWTIRSVRDHGGLPPGEMIEAIFNPDFAGQKKRVLNMQVLKVEALPDGQCKIWLAPAEAEARPHRRPPKEPRCPIVIVPRSEWDDPRV